MAKKPADIFYAMYGVLIGLPAGAHKEKLSGLTRELETVTNNLLTKQERYLLDMLANCMTQFSTEVVAEGPTRTADINEFAMGIHRLQHTIMAQAAARAYPDTFRLLGRTIQG